MPPGQRRRTLKPANVIGDRVRQVREQRAISQARCASLLQATLQATHPDIQIEIDQSDISRIERGERPVWDYELRALSIVLGVSADWILGLPEGSV